MMGNTNTVSNEQKAALEKPKTKKGGKKKPMTAKAESKKSQGSALDKLRNSGKAEPIQIQSGMTAGAIGDALPEIKQSPALLKKIIEGLKVIDGEKSKRAACNSRIKAVYDDLEVEGISRKEMKVVSDLNNCDEMQRKFRDQSRKIIRQALDIPDSTQVTMDFASRVVSKEMDS